jgi:flagellar assembly factor FliW
MTTSGRVAIESARFGAIELETSQLIHFDGLPGFPELRRLAVLQHDRESPFGWLLSLERPELAFPVTDPRQFFPDYRPVLEPGHLRALDAEPADELEWLVIGRIAEGSVSLNLAAPLVINPRSRRGLQAILEPGRFSIREPLPLPAAPASPPAQTESRPQTNSGQGSREDSPRR